MLIIFDKWWFLTLMVVNEYDTELWRDWSARIAVMIDLNPGERKWEDDVATENPGKT